MERERRGGEEGEARGEGAEADAAERQAEALDHAPQQVAVIAQPRKQVGACRAAHEPAVLPVVLGSEELQGVGEAVVGWGKA